MLNVVNGILPATGGQHHLSRRDTTHMSRAARPSSASRAPSILPSSRGCRSSTTSSRAGTRDQVEHLPAGPARGTGAHREIEHRSGRGDHRFPRDQHVRKTQVGRSFRAAARRPRPRARHSRACCSSTSRWRDERRGEAGMCRFILDERRVRHHDRADRHDMGVVMDLRPRRCSTTAEDRRRHSTSARQPGDRRSRSRPRTPLSRNLTIGFFALPPSAPLPLCSAGRGAAVDQFPGGLASGVLYSLVALGRC